MNYNKTVFVGNLGRDPELRYLPDGKAVCSFSVASTRKWTAADGQPGEETTWYRVSAWGKLGENCNQHLSKGRQVLVEGQLTPDRDTGGPRIWTDNEGNPRASFEIRALSVLFLGGGSGSQGPSGPAPDEAPIKEDEIPF